MQEGNDACFYCDYEINPLLTSSNFFVLRHLIGFLQKGFQSQMKAL